MYNLILLLCMFQFIYEDSDSLIVYDDSLAMAGNHTYNVKVYMRNARITITPWSGTADSTGWLTLISPSITCHLQTTIQGSGSGYWGGSTGHGDGYGPGAGEVGGTSGGGGGGAGYGGNGGEGGDYYPGSGGSMYGDPSDTLIETGSGGGAGYYISAIDGYGGSGGAMVKIGGRTVTIDSTDIITNGFPGENGTIGLEAGGGGSGGGILVIADTIILYYSSLSAIGGDGGDSEFGGGGGGSGGRIKVLYMAHFDSLLFSVSAAGGAGGSGYQGSNGDDGDTGSMYIAPLVGTTEYAAPSAPLTLIHGSIVRTSLVVRCTHTPMVLHVYDATGRLVETFPLTNVLTTLPVNTLCPGVYYLMPEHYRSTSLRIVVIR